MGTTDCLVLSGGGAKGAYGAGVAKALEAYRKGTNAESSFCYVGTSAGALNAAVLATSNADTLIDFWMTATPRKVLSARFKSARFQGALHFLTRRRFFSVYRSGGLHKLIKTAANLAAIKARNAHLIIAATNYTRAELRAFYVSPLIDEFIKLDGTFRAEQQRLAHFRPIATQEQLEQCLLASAAIPVFFPPVNIDNEWYVDGGIGNHTPTREAAYFLRYLVETNRGDAGVVYCVKQDPPRVILDEEGAFVATEVLKRTLEIYHRIHTEPIVRAWSRINREVRHHQERVDELLKWLSTQAIPQQLLDELNVRMREGVGTLGEATARLERELIEIEPSVSLGDTLDFDPVEIKKTITHGYSDMLGVLRTKGWIDATAYQTLVNQPLFS